MTENAANHGASKRTWNFESADFLDDLFPLDPAAAFGGSDHRAGRGDARIIQALVASSTIVGGKHGNGCITRFLDARVPADDPRRRNAVIHAHRRQGRIPARTQDDTATGEADVFADFPGLRETTSDEARSLKPYRSKLRTSSLVVNERPAKPSRS